MRLTISRGKPEGPVRVWDLDAGKLLHTLEGHRGQVSAATISADGRRAFSGGTDTTVRVWNLTSGVELASFVSGDSITVMAATPLREW